MYCAWSEKLRASLAVSNALPALGGSLPPSLTSQMTRDQKTKFCPQDQGLPPSLRASQRWPVPHFKGGDHMLMMYGVARRILVSTNMLKWWIMSSTPVKETLLSGGLSGGLYSVWLCMWSSRERGSRFKVRSRGSSSLKVKQEARVRKWHYKRTGKRRMLLHMMKGKATSETDKVLNLTTAIMGADQRNTPQDKTELKRRKKQAGNLSQSLIQPHLEDMNSEPDCRPS